MPVVFAPLNRELKIIKILVDEKTKRHLESLGIMCNAKIKILSVSNGNVICFVKDGKLALDSGIASKIFVA